MARPKNMIPRYITIDTEELAIIQSAMNENEIGAWWKKALMDIRSGCNAADVDPFIKTQFEIAKTRMNNRQALDAKIYSEKRKPRKAIKPKTTAKKESEPAPATAENTLPLDPAKVKSGYGPNHLVMLTMDEGTALRELYGKDLEMAFEFLDDYLSQSEKNLKRYTSHYHVLRKGNWVWKKVQETKITETRLETAQQNKKNSENRDGRSFREREMDARGKEAAFLNNLFVGEA